MSQMTRCLIAAALIGAMIVTAERLETAAEAPYDVNYLPKSTVLRLMSLGHPTLAANAYWLKVVQYVGDSHANVRGWDKLYPMLNLVTDLDPAHGYAYQVGGVLLGSVGRIEESNAILEKGMRSVPDRYILPFLRAFNAFYYEDDFALAGRYAELAARAPGAPPHMRQTAMAFYVKGRRADMAVEFLQQLSGDARDPETAKALNEQLTQARFEQYAQYLDDAVRRFVRNNGAPPVIVQQLVAAGTITSIPPDPYGGEWIIGPDGRVRSTRHAFRFKRPGEIPRGAEPGVTPATEHTGTNVR